MREGGRVYCSRCGAVARAGAKFCSRCGAALRVRACLRCGAVVRAGARFCSRCGSQLEQAEPFPAESAADSPQRLLDSVAEAELAPSASEGSVSSVGSVSPESQAGVSSATPVVPVSEPRVASAASPMGAGASVSPSVATPVGVGRRRWVWGVVLGVGFLVVAIVLARVLGGVPEPDRPLPAVAAGKTHSLVLTESGEVYAWGDNDDGQLGLGDREERLTPTKVEGLPKVKAIAAGGAHSLALTESGEVYAWGWNREGQLGLGEMGDWKVRLTPTKVEGLPKVKAIAAGGGYSLALTESGEVYAWGNNAIGQLGLGDREERLTPTKVTDLRR